MHMRKMYLGIDTCMFPLPVMQMLLVIIAMVLAIKCLNVGRGTCSHMEASTTTMLCRKVDIEHLEIKDLHGTKGKMSMYEQEVHRFQLLVTT